MKAAPLLKGARVKQSLIQPLKNFLEGLDSQFAIVETIVTGLQDAFPRQLRPKEDGKRPWLRKTALVVSVCTVGFLLGIPFTCRGGSYLIDLLVGLNTFFFLRNALS